MMNFYDEMNELINGIMRADIDRSGVEQAIRRLKDKYGDDSFPDFDFRKQNKPWTEEYLKSLKIKNVTGACSEEFILHMAEVSDYLSKKRKKKNILIIVVVLLSILTVLAVFSLRKTQEQKMSRMRNNIYEETIAESLMTNLEISQKEERLNGDLNDGKEQNDGWSCICD